MGLKDLVGDIFERSVRAGLVLIELGYEIFDQPFAQPIEDGQLLVDEGPDDLFPVEDFVSARMEIEVPDDPRDEWMVNKQWGLRLPNGEVHWNMWQGNHFNHPVDRTRLVAKLQATAADIGLAPGEQTEEFLSKYHWVMRTVLCKETGVCPLAHPQAFEMDAPDAGGRSSHDGQDAEEPDAASVNGQNPGLDLCPRPLGSDTP